MIYWSLRGYLAGKILDRGMQLKDLYSMMKMRTLSRENIIQLIYPKNREGDIRKIINQMAKDDRYKKYL